MVSAAACAGCAVVSPDAASQPQPHDIFSAASASATPTAVKQAAATPDPIPAPSKAPVTLGGTATTSSNPTTSATKKTTANVAAATVTNVAIPYTTSRRDDATLAKGTTRVVQAGVDGVKQVTTVDQKVTKTKVVREPVEEIVAVGTKPTQPTITSFSCSLSHLYGEIHIQVSDPDDVGYIITATVGKKTRTVSGLGTGEVVAKGSALRTTPCTATLAS